MSDVKAIIEGWGTFSYKQLNDISREGLEKALSTVIASIAKLEGGFAADREAIIQSVSDLILPHDSVHTEHNDVCREIIEIIKKRGK